MAKVSIIIPVYGVEKYVEQSIKSLFKQTFDDIEYIIVNDCTKDSSMDIILRVLEEYPYRKGQVKIINHDENKGLMYTRRTGYKNATGDYFIFCDSDDYMPENAVEILYGSIVESSVDIVFSNFVRHENGTDYPSKRSSEICHNVDDVYKNLIQKKTKTYLWGNIYSRHLFEYDYDYIPNQTINEDFILLVQILNHCESFKFIDDYLYYYIINSDSSTGSFSYSRFLQELRAIEWMLDYFKGNKYEDYSIVNAIKRINILLIYGFSYAQIQLESPMIVDYYSWSNRKKYISPLYAYYTLMLQYSPFLCKLVYYLKKVKHRLFKTRVI